MGANHLCDDCGDPWHGVPCGWGDRGTAPGWAGFKGETRCECRSDWHDDPSRSPKLRAATARREAKLPRSDSTDQPSGDAVWLIVFITLVVVVMVVGQHFS